MKIVAAGPFQGGVWLLILCFRAVKAYHKVVLQIEGKTVGIIRVGGTPLFLKGGLGDLLRKCLNFELFYVKI